jgi:hypothetical protein
VYMVGRIGIEPMTLGLRVVGKLLVTSSIAVALYRGCHVGSATRHYILTRSIRAFTGGLCGSRAVTSGLRVVGKLLVTSVMPAPL